MLSWALAANPWAVAEPGLPIRLSGTETLIDERDLSGWESDLGVKEPPSPARDLWAAGSP